MMGGTPSKFPLRHPESLHLFINDSTLHSHLVIPCCHNLSHASQAARAGARLVEYESTLAAMHTDLKKKDELINMIHNLAKNAPAAGR